MTRAVFATTIAFMSPAHALLPVTGKPVPELQAFEDAMQTYMQMFSVHGGVLCISRNGRVIYQRGFGYLHPAPSFEWVYENTPMRIASVEKPLTAAAIRKLIADGAVGLNYSDKIFHLSQPGGGILSYVPWNGLGTPYLADITVQHALQHMSGWDRTIVDICTLPTGDPRPEWGDPMNDEICIAGRMGIPTPPTRNDLIRYMLNQPLQHTPPGTTYAYSNFGYMLLGRVIEQRTGADPLSYIFSNIMTPDRWVARSEIFYGRTFAVDQNPREPTYFDPDQVTNVFNPGGPAVWQPYGGFAIENMVGHGNLVASAAPLVKYMDYYQVAMGSDCGTPLGGAAAREDVHGGTLPGTGSFMRQRNDGVNYVALFNDSAGQGQVLIDLIDALINAGGIAWPTLEVDGFWVDFGYAGPNPQFGAYNAPFRTITAAIGLTLGNGAKLHVKPGVSGWTGILNYKMKFDAPLGAARIGG